MIYRIYFVSYLFASEESWLEEWKEFYLADRFKYIILLYHTRNNMSKYYYICLL